MKQILLLSLTSLALFSSCKKDDDAAPVYSFKEQDLSGKIGGKAWTYADGYSDVDGTTANITLVLAQDKEGCEMGIPDGDEVFFSVPQKVGVYTLKLGGNESQTVTLLEHADFMNNIASNGAIEILSITDTQIKGRIDARSDADNSVNGNFTVAICK